MRQFSQISFGKSLFNIETGGFVLTETKHPPGFLLPGHSHQQANIVFVLEGRFTEKVGNRTFQCSPRSLLIKPASATHSNKYDESGARSLIIEIQPRRLNESGPLSNTFSEVKQIDTGVMFATVSRIRRELRKRDPVSGLAVEGLALELLAQLTRLGGRAEPPGESQRAGRARDFIHAHFSEPVSLSAVAESVGVHPAHLARVFRARYRCSVGDYIRRLRIDRAARQLAGTDDPLASIAACAGFYDQSHFTNSFKLHTGMTPAGYRSAARGRKPLPRGQRPSKK
jgi:AraC family transcriptional regulator